MSINITNATMTVDEARRRLEELHRNDAREEASTKMPSAATCRANETRRPEGRRNAALEARAKRRQQET